MIESTKHRIHTLSMRCLNLRGVFQFLRIFSLSYSTNIGIGGSSGREKKVVFFSTSKRFEALHAGEAESEEGDEDDDDAGDDEDFEDDEHEKSKSDKSYLVIIKLKEYQITGDKLYQVIKVKLKVI